MLTIFVFLGRMLALIVLVPGYCFDIYLVYKPEWEYVQNDTGQQLPGEEA